MIKHDQNTVGDNFATKQLSEQAYKDMNELIRAKKLEERQALISNYKKLYCIPITQQYMHRIDDYFNQIENAFNDLKDQ